jgi:hypothetical protein
LSPLTKVPIVCVRCRPIHLIRGVIGDADPLNPVIDARGHFSPVSEDVAIRATPNPGFQVVGCCRYLILDCLSEYGIMCGFIGPRARGLRTGMQQPYMSVTST